MDKRILLVEDDELVRSMYRDVLEVHGFHAYEARHGADALRRLAALKSEHDRLPVDLVVTDISMPEMDGVELAEALGREYPGIGILAITAVGDKETVIRLMRAGVCDYLDKPVGMGDFIAKIEDLLREDGQGGAVGELRRLHRELDALVQDELHHQRDSMLEWIRGGINHRFNQPLSVLGANVALQEKLLNQIDLDPVLDEMGRASLADMREALRCLSHLLRMLASLREMETASYVGDAKILDLERSAGSADG